MLRPTKSSLDLKLKTSVKYLATLMLDLLMLADVGPRHKY